MARLVTRLWQAGLPGAALSLASLVGVSLLCTSLGAGPAVASIVPATIPPAPPEPAPPVASPPAPPPPVAAPNVPAPNPDSQVVTPTSVEPVEPKLAPPDDLPPPGWTAVPDDAAPGPPPPAASGAAIGATPRTVTLDRPSVPNTGRLTAAAQTVSLDGVAGLAGVYARNLHGAIAAAGGQVICHQQHDDAYRCLLPNGTDVAALALRNGAAEARADAPARYHELEARARQERRGVWGSLPPPPMILHHPTVIDTATLAAGGRTFPLAGVEGLGGSYARDLRNYIAAQGDRVTCNAAGDGSRYVCLLAGQTDIARLVLVNGAAQVTPDAPDSYRAEQADALANRRGYWANAPEDARRSALATSRPRAGPRAAGDDGSDGVHYIGGQPTATIGGQTVFLQFAGAIGWGYWDRHGQWQRAPAAVIFHMERYHPAGAGLPGYAAAGGGGQAPSLLSLGDLLER